MEELAVLHVASAEWEILSFLVERGTASHPN